MWRSLVSHMEKNWIFPTICKYQLQLELWPVCKRQDITFRIKCKERLLWLQDRKTFLKLDSKVKIIKKETDRFNYIKIRTYFQQKIP